MPSSPHDTETASLRLSRATIRDVARESGVSVATVSYVVNDGPRAVSPQTRARVLATIQRLDYQPNAMARGLVRQRIHTLGVFFGYSESSALTNPYSAGVLQGIYEVAAEHAYNVTLITTSWKEQDPPIEALRDGRTDGLLVLGPLRGSRLLEVLAQSRRPAVLISTSDAHPALAAVDIENERGARLATEHLLSLGHRRIAHISGEAVNVHACRRREGFLATMKAAGLEVPAEHIAFSFYGMSQQTRTRQVVADMLSSPTPPTALFAGNDVIALAAMETAIAQGFRVPERFSIVGFDDNPTASLVTPPLTTVHQPFALIGRRAATLLMRAINGDLIGAQDTVLLAPELIVRSSTAPPFADGR